MLDIPEEEKRELGFGLLITDAWEGIQLFVNGISGGVQIVPPYEFDISNLINSGVNDIAIVVSTTLERERRAGKESILEILQHKKAMSPTGITGEIEFYSWKKK